MGRPKIRFSRPSGAFQVPTPGNSVCSRCSSKESTIGPVFWISVVRRVPETRPTVMVDKKGMVTPFKDSGRTARTGQ